MMPLPPPPAIPGMPPMPTMELVQTSEKLTTVAQTAMPYCFKRCVGYFTEDSLPYHYGEKTCTERCTSKLQDSLQLAKELRGKLDAKAKLGQYNPPWLVEVQAEARKQQQQNK
eukprot:PhM_4_TR1349/c0_g1_i1/m.96674